MLLITIFCIFLATFCAADHHTCSWKPTQGAPSSIGYERFCEAGKEQDSHGHVEYRCNGNSGAYVADQVIAVWNTGQFSRTIEYGKFLDQSQSDNATLLSPEMR